MNLFDYVDEMKDLDTPVATIGIAILLLFLVFIIFKMLFGMRRGPRRQIIGTIFTLASAIISIGVSVFISNKIIGSLSANDFEGLVEYIEGIKQGAGETLREAIANMNLELLEYLTLLPATTILLPILSVVIFLVLNLIFKIPRAIINKICKFEKSRNNSDRLFGAILSAVEAIICLTVLMLPFASVADLTDRTFESAIKSANRDDREDLNETYTEYIIPFTQNPAISFVDKIGSRPMYNSIATVKIDGEKTNVREEILGITDVILSEMPVLDDADMTHPTAKEKKSIERVIDVFHKSKFMSTIVVSAVQSSSSMMRNNVIDIEMGGAYESLFDDLLSFLEGVNKKTLKDDLETIKQLYFTVADSGVLDAALEGEDLMELLQEKRKQGDDAIKNIVEILQANERTAPLVTSLTEALIATLSNNIELGEDVTVTYDEIKTGMNEVLSVKKDNYETTEEYMDALSGTLDNTLRDHGIEIEEEIVDSIAEYIDTNYAETEDLSDEEFNDILLHYYDAYLEYLENGEIPDGVIPDNTP